MSQEIITANNPDYRKELIKLPLKKSGSLLSRSVSRIAEAVPIGDRSKPEKPIKEGILAQFMGHVGVTTGLLEADDPKLLRKRAASTVGLMSREAIIDEDTELVEIRPMAPGKIFGEWDQSYDDAAKVLIDVLQDEYQVPALTVPDPIEPAHDADPLSFWETVGADLTEVRRYQEGPVRHLSVLAIVERPYIEQLLSQQPGFDGSNAVPDMTSPLLVARPIAVDDAPRPAFIPVDQDETAGGCAGAQAPDLRSPRL